MRSIEAGTASLVNCTFASADGAAVAVDHPGSENIPADGGLSGTADEGEIRIRRAEPVVEFCFVGDGCFHIVALLACVPVFRG